jgi:hypothetical protein
VPPPNPSGDVVATALVPIRYLVGALRVLLSLLIALIYFLLVDVVCIVFVRELAVLVLTSYAPHRRFRGKKPIPLLHRGITRVLTAILAHLALFVVSFFWISVNLVSRKRGYSSMRSSFGSMVQFIDLCSPTLGEWGGFSRSAKDSLQETRNPQPGDIIVSNWVSWIEILWLASR